jgi:sulfur relay (sulfurtransferase) complex TusBCD TusD component (DsrE family)
VVGQRGAVRALTGSRSATKVRSMVPQRRKLGILLSTQPEHPNFTHGVRLAETALAEGVDVYLYCIDDAVHGVADARLQALRANGLKLYACAFAAQRRGVVLNDQAVFAGLTIVSDLIGGTDRFVNFN